MCGKHTYWLMLRRRIICVINCLLWQKLNYLLHVSFLSHHHRRRSHDNVQDTAWFALLCPQIHAAVNIQESGTVNRHSVCQIFFCLPTRSVPSTTNLLHDVTQSASPFRSTCSCHASLQLFITYSIASTHVPVSYCAALAFSHAHSTPPPDRSYTSLQVVSEQWAYCKHSYLTEVSSLERGWLSNHIICFNLQLLSLVGNTWRQCCLSGPLSRYFLVGHGIFCLLFFLLLVIVVMGYVL